MKRLFPLSLFFLLALFGAQAQTRTEQHPAFKVEIYGQGQPLYLIPGATCSGDVWQETVARYQNQYQCHVFTLAGYAGQTPLPEADNYLPRHQAALQNFIAERGPGIVMGHSIGGYLAMWLASDRPELVTKLIIVDALPFLRASSDAYAAETDPRATAEQYYAAIKDIPAESFAQMQLPVVQGMIKDSTRWPTVTEWGVTSDRRTLAFTFNEMLSQDLRDDIARIKAPTLIMGQFDEPLPQYPNLNAPAIRTNLEKQYAKLPKATILVAEGSRHFIMYDVPEWFNAQVDRFLASAN